jgi:hypothetical protein
MKITREKFLLQKRNLRLRALKCPLASLNILPEAF